MPKENNINFGELNINNNEQTNSSNNFGNIENNNNNNNNITQEKTSIIGQANETAQTDTNTQNNNINLDDITIQEEKPQTETKIKFGTDGTDFKNRKHYHINYRKIFILSFSTIVLSSLISIFLYMYNDYIVNYSTSTMSQETTISISISKIKDMLNTYIYQDHNANNNIILNGEQGQNNLKTLIESESNYIQKKETLNTSIKNLINSILLDHQTLDKTKKIITKNGFLSEDIGEIINGKQQIGSIQNSLLSLEAIKFSSAISVFSYLDTFIESLSKTIDVSKDTIQQNTQKIIERGEKDINLYITNCYLNPFETNYKCNIIGDFNKYYKMTNDDKFDIDFFKELMYYTDTKLEQTELPSFSITFQKFDQNKDEITFNIDINTFKQDEIQLAKNGILSPHIFIFTNLINNLKQSKFIVGEGISTKNLQIDTKVIDIGSTQFVIHNSNKTFTLPIQKESEREIFDFVESNQ